MSNKRLPPTSIDSIAIGGSKEVTTNARDAKAYLWAATIVHVDNETMVCSIRLGSGVGERHDVPITAASGSGPRSWAGAMPERGARVIIGWKKFGNRGHVPYIIEYLTPGVFPARDFEPFSSLDPNDAQKIKDIAPDVAEDPGIFADVVRLKSRKVYSGDFLATSSGGSDFILDRDGYLVNRAGNEFRLRDSDQTSILQTVNEFTSNSAGYYRRGLIKRNAFSFLPDLYPLDKNGVPLKVISPGDPANGVDPDTGEPLDRNPAYDILLSFGLIKEDGTKNFPDDPKQPFYPHVVAPDGQRIAYVVHGEPEFSFSDTAYSYVEDRRELRHISDGIMAVTEEGDGFQVDPPFPVMIEDVHGTVVGNDFHSDAGRPLYKRVLSMKIFQSPDQGTLADGPTLEAVDTVQRLSLMDDVALARLYRVQSPNSSNQYVFGVTKEGKVLLHIPKTRAGDPQEKGKSAEVNIQGLVKAIIGADENSNNTSIDLKTLGGINLEVGRFSDGNSIVLNLHGKIKKIHNGNDNNGLTNEEIYGGSTHKNTSGSESSIVGGTSVENIGGEKALIANSISLNAGTGGLKTTVAGDVAITVLGKSQSQNAQLANSTYALGKKQLILSGVDDNTLLAGNRSYTVVSGLMTNTVTSGSMNSVVTTGTYSVNVGTGSFAATIGSGSLSMTCSAGPMSLSTSTIMSIVATTSTSIASPFTKIGTIGVGFAVAGIPGPPSPALDYLTGLPLLGQPSLQIG